MTDVDDGVAALRELIMAGQTFRLSVAEYLGVGMREAEALNILRVLGPVRQHDLGTELKLTPGTITNLVDRLESQGLATREPAPNDRRATLVTLTPRAQQSAQEVGLRLAQCFREAAGASPAETTRLLVDLARALRTNSPAASKDAAQVSCSAPG